MKVCRKCNIPKEEIDFCKDKKSSDGLHSYCKKCKQELIYAYYEKYPERRAKRSKEENLKRYHEDKVHQNVARILRLDLKGTKKEKTFEMLGFTVEELKTHLENLFSEGMTWENYGKWHIDHKIPRSLLPFKRKGEENFIKCWSLENLQPLWRLDNIRKSNKMLLSSTD